MLSASSSRVLGAWWAYRALHLTTPHVVELVVRHLRRSLRQLADSGDYIVNRFLRSLENIGYCVHIRRDIAGPATYHSRSFTGVEWALDSTNETLRSGIYQKSLCTDFKVPTVLLECLYDVAQLLSRCEYAVTCSSIRRHSHPERRCLRLRAPGDPGRWPG